MPGSCVLHYLLEFAQIHILCLLFLLLPSFFPSMKIFSNELVLLIRQPRYWSFSNSPSNEYSGLISFKIDWLDLLAVQGTLKSRLQHHSSKATILWRSAFFMAGKNIALAIWIFVGKVMSLLFNMLSRFVIAFLPKSKRLLISWLQESSAVNWEPKKIKSVSISIVSASICHEMM